MRGLGSGSSTGSASAGAVEEQAFHAPALERMAEILVVLEEDEAADRFLGRAEDLRRRWHEAGRVTGGRSHYFRGK